jgi:hypothetical protein
MITNAIQRFVLVKILSIFFICSKKSKYCSNFLVDLSIVNRETEFSDY